MTLKDLFKKCKIGSAHKSINVVHYGNRIKNKTHTITSRHTENAFDKIQHPFMTKILKKKEREN